VLVDGPLVTPALADVPAAARQLEAAGYDGAFTFEGPHDPFLPLVLAADATERLELMTAVAIAFARNPMTLAVQGHDLQRLSRGRFHLGLGSQVRAHVERRYGVAFDPPGPRLRDYVLAVKDVLAAFRGAPLRHEGPYYELTLLPDQWRPPAHPHGDVKVDVSAVGPWMTRMAGEVADGVHVHPLHSEHYIEHRLLPAVAEGAARAGRRAEDVDLLVPVFIVPGDTEEERAPLARRARQMIAFYGSTRNYAFQFDDVDFPGTSAVLNERLKAGDLEGLEATITDEMLETFAVVGRWDEIADRLRDRYEGRANRVMTYLTAEEVRRHPERLGRWSEIAAALA
jgi:probable F420-dependent oxidoreductase